MLDIYIYGPNQSTGDPATNPGQGALCYGQFSSTTGPCGIPLSLWNDNGTTLQTMPGAGRHLRLFLSIRPQLRRRQMHGRDDLGQWPMRDLGRPGGVFRLQGAGRLLQRHAEALRL